MSNSSKKHIALLMGGLSAEREVSIMSGKRVIEALEQLGYKYTIVDPSIDLYKKLTDLKPDVVFNCLHGTYGEDGAIPGLLELLRIPYTHSGILASSIAFNKRMSILLLSQTEIKIPTSIILNISDLRDKNLRGIFPLPFVIKPISQGSSLGVYIIKEDNIDNFRLNDWQYGEQLIVEQYIPGHELSSAYFDGKSLGVLELKTTDKFLTYHAKYTANVTNHIIPAAIPSDVYELAQKYTEIAHNTLGCRTISRTDFRFDSSKGIDGLYFLEINTHPGLTLFSIAPDITKHSGYEFKQVVDKLIQDAKLELNP